MDMNNIQKTPEQQIDEAVESQRHYFYLMLETHMKQRRLNGI